MSANNVLFLGIKTIKERTGVHANIDEKLVLPEILATQDMYIMPILGSTLYRRLQEGLRDDDLSDDETTLKDDYIVPCLLNYVLSELPDGISYQFYNKGVLRKQNENSDLPDVDELSKVQDRYRNRAEFYGQQLVNYLKESAKTTKYPEYNEPGTRCDVVHPIKKSYSVSIYIPNESE